MRTKIKLFLFPLLFTSALTFTLFSCSSNPTEPPPPPLLVEPDSTTQNFTFETFEFGDGFSSSYLNDVWVFNENNIWAVGDIGPDNGEIGTNILRWNGSKWFRFEREFVSTGFTGIWAVDSNNIYFASGVIRKYENGAVKTIDLTHLTFSNNQSVNKLWGSSENNLYGVGRNGIIVHYDGVNWTKIDFDTQWYFYGITGDPKKGIAYAFAQNTSDIRIIVELNNSTATIIHQSQQITAVKANAINFIDSTLYLAGSDFSSTLLWKFNPQTKQADSLYALPPTTAIDVISGEKKIDMFYWGEDYNAGKMVHYNGKRYKIFDLSKTNEIRGGASSHNNISAVAGQSNNKGFVIIVKRMK